MLTDYFQFKKFGVHHGYSSMKVGTDAVLLGTLANAPAQGRILEVGTGCGIISLILAQRSNAEITAIDIHQNSVWEARANFKASPWNERLKALLISFQAFADRENPIRFDKIVSNPPFFENDLKSPNPDRNLARHNDTLTQRDFLKASRNFITEKGQIAIILPTVEAFSFREEAIHFGFYLFRQIKIIPKAEKKANRMILEFGNEKPEEIISETLTIRNQDNSYSESYRSLTEDYYISLK